MDLRFNTSLAEGYKSASQIARVLTEDWLARNMYCPICGEVSIEQRGFDPNEAISKELASTKDAESKLSFLTSILDERQLKEYVEWLTSIE